MEDMAMKIYAGSADKGRGARILANAITISLTMICVGLTGCDSTSPGNGLLRFGSVGEVRVTVESPLQGGIGWRQQVLTWNSDGAWTFYEEIGYDGVVGDESLTRNPGLPIQFAANYPSLIQLVNEREATKLFGLPDTLFSPNLDPDCGVGKSRVTLLIFDSRRNEQMQWPRCAADTSPLATLKTQGSGPDTHGSRVIQLAINVRDWTIGEDFRYAYTGSWPFATLDKGTETESGVDGPRVFRTPDGAEIDDTPQHWAVFWDAHADTTRRPVPEVDWATQMVVVGAVGERDEVGDSVEVRRVLQIGDQDRVTGTRIEIVERIPGDYCAPARRIVRPYHIVVAPKAPEPVDFAVRSERVPCGAS